MNWSNLHITLYGTACLDATLTTACDEKAARLMAEIAFLMHRNIVDHSEE